MNKVTVKHWPIDADDVVVDVFEGVVGHQIGNGAVQVIFPDGSIKVIANFSVIDIEPDEEAKEKFLEQAREAYGFNEKEKAKEPAQIEAGSTEDVGN